MSVNYMQGGELVQVAGNTDAIPNGEKGKAGGVATLDSEGKIPIGQLPEITALDVNAVPRYTKVFAGEGVGWYRIGNISLTSSFSFTLNVDREWSNGVPEGFSILIRCIHKTVNPPSHGLSFLQTSALSGNKHIDKIRIVINQKEKKGFLDLHYSSNLWNQIYVRIDNIAQSQGAMDVDMESTVMDPEIREDDQVFEYAIVRNGMVADCAIADGSGNNIADTYMTRSQGLKYVVNPETNGYKEGDVVSFNVGGTEENPKHINTLPWSCKYAFAGGVYQLDLPSRPVPVEVQLINATLIITGNHVIYPMVRIRYAEQSVVKATQRCGVFVDMVHNSTFINLNIYGTCIGLGGTLRNCNVSIVTHSKDIFTLDGTHGTFYTLEGAVTV